MPGINFVVFSITYQLELRKNFVVFSNPIFKYLTQLKIEKNPMDKVISLSMNKKKAYEVRKISQFIGNICNGKHDKKFLFVISLAQFQFFFYNLLFLCKKVTKSLEIITLKSK